MIGRICSGLLFLCCLIDLVRAQQPDGRLFIAHEKQWGDPRAGLGVFDFSSNVYQTLDTFPAQRVYLNRHGEKIYWLADDSLLYFDQQSGVRLGGMTAKGATAVAGWQNWLIVAYYEPPFLRYFDISQNYAPVGVVDTLNAPSGINDIVVGGEMLFAATSAGNGWYGQIRAYNLPLGAAPTVIDSVVLPDFLFFNGTDVVVQAPLATGLPRFGYSVIDGSSSKLKKKDIIEFFEAYRRGACSDSLLYFLNYTPGPLSAVNVYTGEIDSINAAGHFVSLAYDGENDFLFALQNAAQNYSLRWRDKNGVWSDSFAVAGNGAFMLYAPKTTPNAIDPPKKAHFKLYPSPAANYFTVESLNPSPINYVRLYNSLGQLAREWQCTGEVSQQFSTAGLAAGVYHAAVVWADKIEVRAFSIGKP